MTELPTTDALDRKKRMISRLETEGVPTIGHLPAIEGESQVQLPTVEAIAYRAMALIVVSDKASGQDPETVERIINNYLLASKFTDLENLFLNEPDPSHQSQVQFSWRIEAAYTLLWVLGYVEKFIKPTDTCDVSSIISIMSNRTAEQFVSDVKLRPLSEILDEADAIYRYHWAVAEAQLTNQTVPAGLNPSVVEVRHYALKWLTIDPDWDDVSTDT